MTVMFRSSTNGDLTPWTCPSLPFTTLIHALAYLLLLVVWFWKTMRQCVTSDAFVVEPCAGVPSASRSTAFLNCGFARIFAVACLTNTVMSGDDALPAKPGGASRRAAAE